MASKTLKASVLIGGSISSSLRSALGTTKNGLTQIGQAITAVDKRQRLLGQSIQTFGRMGRNVDGLRRQYDDLTRASDRLRAAQSRLASVQKAVDANMARRQQLGGQMMGAVGAAVATGFAIGRPVMNAANFARENRLIGNTADMSREQVKALGDTIIAASKDTNQGANELQRAVGFLVAAGMDARTAEASIRTIGRTTTAAGADIEDLSRASFTLIDSLKIKPEGLQQALDALAVAGKEGNVELKDMAKVMPVLGASFVALKMDGMEAAATMGAALEVARKGAADADEAANNMKNFMAKILSPETLKKAQKNFGLDLYAVIQNAQKTGGNPFEAAMKAIMKATAGDQKKIGELFQDMQVQNFLRPMIQNWDEYNRIKDKALNKSAGTTDRDFALMMEQESEQMKAAKIAADNLAKTFGATLLPTIGAAAGKLSVLLDKTTAFVKANPALVVGATKVAAGLVGLRVATLGIGYAWTFIKGPILSVMGFVARWRAAGAISAMGRFAGAGMRVAGVFRWVGTAIAAIGGGPVTAAVAAIVVGALVIRKYWEPIKAFLGGVWDGFSSAVGPAMEGFLAAIEPLKPAWDAVSGALGAAWKWVVDLLAPINATNEQLTEAGRVGQVVGKLIATNIQLVITVIGAAIKAVVWLGESLGTAAGWIVVTWTSAWDKVKSVVGSAVDWMLAKIKPLTDGIGWVMDKASSIGDAASGLWNSATGAPGGGAAPALAAAGRAPPNIPTPAGGRAGGTTQVQQSNVFHITQQPGESNQDLARRIAEQQKRAEGVKRRGALTDGMTE